MKHLILILAALFSLSICNAKVVKYSDIFLGSHAEFKFAVETRNDSIFLVVNIISQDAKIRDDAKMLIKYADGNVVKLQGSRLENGIVNSVSGSSGGANGFSYGSTSTTLYYYSVAAFYIKKEDIERFKDGIVKIRINTSPDIYTKEWIKDKIGKGLYEQYAKSSSNSFEDDF